MTRTFPVLALLLLPACYADKLEAILAKYDSDGWADSSTGAHTGTSSSTGLASTTDPDQTTGDTSDTTEPATASTGTSGTAGAGDTTDTSAATGSGTDAGSSSTGPAEPFCGDGLKEGDEECDDANDIEADGCLSDCTKEWFVFITSLPATSGDIKGLIGADYQCRHRATKMFLPKGERYMAWISTSEVQPVDRLYHARGPYKLVNGLRVAANWDALIVGPLEHSIIVTEMAETNDALVFTGTQPDGTRAPNSTFCDDWTDNGTDLTWYGDAASTNKDWTFAIEASCGGGAAIYCFEQP